MDEQDQFHEAQESRETTSTTPSTPANKHIFGKIEFPKITSNLTIEHWFVRLESWFRLQDVQDEVVRFEAVVASLTPELFDQVIDVVVSPPQNNPYKVLKATLIAKFTDSEYTRVDKLLSTVPLGAQRPSRLLNEIRRAGATQDENILRVCWLRRLPVTIRTILSASKGSLVELAVIADAAFDTIQSEHVSQVATSSSSLVSQPQTSTQHDAVHIELVKCIGELSLQISELRQSRSRENQQRRDNSKRSHSRHRDSTPSTKGQPTCWFHRNYGTQARNCTPPCDFPSTFNK